MSPDEVTTVPKIIHHFFRPYGPDHYLGEAKRLKHKADSSVSLKKKFETFLMKLLKMC